MLTLLILSSRISEDDVEVDELAVKGCGRGSAMLDMMGKWQS